MSARPRMINRQHTALPRVECRTATSPVSVAGTADEVLIGIIQASSLRSKRAEYFSGSRLLPQIERFRGRRGERECDFSSGAGGFVRREDRFQHRFTIF